MYWKSPSFLSLSHTYVHILKIIFWILALDLLSRFSRHSSFGINIPACNCSPGRDAIYLSYDRREGNELRIRFGANDECRCVRSGIFAAYCLLSFAVIATPLLPGEMRSLHVTHIAGADKSPDAIERDAFISTAFSLSSPPPSSFSLRRARCSRQRLDRLGSRDSERAEK